MKYQAKWENEVVAEADEQEVLIIEGNVYFPKSSIREKFFKPSETSSTCHWKGEASYFDIQVGDETNKDAAWYYASPKDGSTERVAISNNNKNDGDFSNFVAFWNGVKIEKTSN